MLEAYLPFFRQGNIIKRASWDGYGIQQVTDDLDHQQHIAMVDLNDECKVIAYIQISHEDFIADDWGLHLCKCDCRK